jgi:hypothetical protein
MNDEDVCEQCAREAEDPNFSPEEKREAIEKMKREPLQD